MIPGHLRMDSSLRRVNESSYSDDGIWTSCFSAQKCSDGLSGHTLRRSSHPRDLEREKERERKKERESKGTHCPLYSITVGFL